MTGKCKGDGLDSITLDAFGHTLCLNNGEWWYLPTSRSPPPLLQLPACHHHRSGP
jgi:hypothetical protein